MTQQTKLSVNPKLMTPVAGEVWVLQSQADNPFEAHKRKKNRVKVEAVRQGWVQYRWVSGSKIREQDNLGYFQHYFQFERGAA